MKTAYDFPFREECHVRVSMKSSIANKIEGTAREAKGKVKEVAGRVANNPDLEAEGTGEKIAGKVERKAGDVKKVFGR